MKDYITEERLNQFMKSAFNEDIGEGDHSTLASVPTDQQGEATLLIKEEGIIAGLELAELIFNFYVWRYRSHGCRKCTINIKY